MLFGSRKVVYGSYYLLVYLHYFIPIIHNILGGLLCVLCSNQFFVPSIFDHVSPDLLYYFICHSVLFHELITFANWHTQ